MGIAFVLRTVAAGACTMMMAASAFAEERVFTRQDYESYFAPGRFASFSPFYQSDGILEVVSSRASTSAGRYFLEQTTRSFDVSANYHVESQFKFYKIDSTHTDNMIWDERRGVYFYDYSGAEFDSDGSLVWESHDGKLDLSDGDLARGDLHQFYRDVDRKAGRDPKVFDEDFRREVVGFWTWACAYLHKDRYDVSCKATHQTSGREETYLFRRLDLVG
jgi:hypothetical protein